MGTSVDGAWVARGHGQEEVIMPALAPLLVFLEGLEVRRFKILSRLSHSHGSFFHFCTPGSAMAPPNGPGRWRCSTGPREERKTQHRCTACQVQDMHKGQLECSQRMVSLALIRGERGQR